MRVNVNALQVLILLFVFQRGKFKKKVSYLLTRDKTEYNFINYK